MSSLPPDPSAAVDPANRPARALMDSPLATSVRVISRRRRQRERPRERALRVLGMVGALLVHIVFLLGFVLGDAYQPTSPPEQRVEALHIRLIDAPEPPPPPPVRGTPPKEKGPRHKGQASATVAAVKPTSAQGGRLSSEPSTAAVTQASRASAEAVTSQVVAASAAPKRQPVAAPRPPVSLPKTAPAPQLQPIPLASEPPVVTMAKPTMTPPVPPRFQAEAVRPPQVEGNQPIPPPASLALPDVPVQAMQSVEKPTIALTLSPPKAPVAPSMAPARAEAPATPPEPELQAIPLAAQPSPKVNLKVSVSVAAPTVRRESVQVQAPAAEPAEAQLEPVPLSPRVKPNVDVRSPTLKVSAADKSTVTAVQTSIQRPELSAAPATPQSEPAASEARAAEGTQTSTAQSSAQSAAAAASPSASTSSSEDKTSSTAPNASSNSSDHDVSTAPNATAQGSDTATPGEPGGVANAPEVTGREGSQLSAAQGQGSTPSVVPGGKGAGAGQDAGTAASGSPAGGTSGTVGSYVQVMPHGDTKIMDHSTPNIGYKSTRFNRDWTPLDESSVDTALRHAVEKTTATHTFHLPRGVRIKCAISPLLPMALFGCGSADPPPPALADKAYDRMHLAPANPVVQPLPASSASTAKAPLQLDNSAECAAARISGGPPPPGCVNMTLPVKLAHPASASSSGSWVPASDQFH